ncbi:periplasmic binding protein-like II [Piromyces finnis]|uniref:Periplasmic binding protein-like II n=1 Tax=Piromyces finnis TaxID=1754191 RepID=A0A1Y1V4K4_9FUNG|nr:periplasmic binding protein-like II [Piromyces finnis]|eukprot:ORX47118.1 periplasmic binding protein-like II [Piromyces finnis]
MYSKGFSKYTCQYDNKWIAFPIYISYNVLYSNEDLLNKYNKQVPLTWNELIKTASYILEEEKKQNNTDLVGYNGYFSDTEDGMASLYEFIYSYRDSMYNSYPNIDSKEASRALSMIKRLKNEISSAKLFLSDETETEKLLKNGKAIFLKYWNLDEEKNHYSYIKSLLPGNIDGVSGSSIGGNNAGINTFISKEKKRATVKVLKYITSKTIQKQLVRNNVIYTGINEIYLEENIYIYLKSRFSIDVQFISRPIFESKNYERFSRNYRKYLHSYIYGNSTLEEIIQNIEDLTKIYTITLDSENTTIGRTLSIIISILAILMTLSLSFPSIHRIKPYLSIFSNNSWTVFVLGSIILLMSSFAVFGQVTEEKCRIKSILIYIGFYFNFSPIMNKYMLMFPKNNKLFMWICNHRNLFYIGGLLLGIGIEMLGFFFSSHVTIVEYENEKRYKKCTTSSNSLFYIINNISWILIFILIISTVSIVIMDYVMIPLKPYCVNFIFISVGITIINLFIYLSLNETKSYISYVKLQVIFHILFSLSLYLFFYIFRLIYLLLLKKFGLLDKNKYDLKSQNDILNNDTSSYEENTKQKINIEQRLQTKKNTHNNSISIINTFATESISFNE